MAATPPDAARATVERVFREEHGRVFAALVRTFGAFDVAEDALQEALIVALVILHKWLPAGTRRMREIMPGIVITMVGSLVSGVVFGQYLARFASNYVTTYAGLASVMIALVFLYVLSAIFIFGGEVNSAILAAARKKTGAQEPPRAG